MIDPSGHSTCFGVDGYGQSCNSGPLADGIWAASETSSGATFFRDDHTDPQLVIFKKDKDHPKEWSIQEMYSVAKGVNKTAIALAEAYNSSLLAADGTNISASEAFLAVFGGSVTAWRSSQVQDYAAEITGKRDITYYDVQLYDLDGNPVRVDRSYTAGRPDHTVHELGHLFDNRTGGSFRGDMVGSLAINEDESYWQGFRCAFQCGRYSKQRHSWEIAADMFLGWVNGNSFGNERNDDLTINYGATRRNHMTNNMNSYMMLSLIGPDH